VGCGNVEFCTSATPNGLHIALSQHLQSFLVFSFIMGSESVRKWRKVENIKLGFKKKILIKIL